MLHGWGYHAGVWREVESAATETTAAITTTQALDLPGYGSRTEDLFPDDLDAVVEDLLQRAPDSAIWAGWSLGGMLAMRAAILAPERVKALLLICTTPKFVRSPDWEWGMDSHQFEAFVSGLSQEYRDNYLRFLLLQTGDSVQARQLRKPIAEVLDSAPMPSLENLLNGLNLLRRIDLRNQLQDLKIPVRIISGAKDAVCFPGASSWMGSELDANLEQLMCGHFPPLSNPREIAQQLDALVAEVTS